MAKNNRMPTEVPQDVQPMPQPMDELSMRRQAEIESYNTGRQLEQMLEMQPKKIGPEQVRKAAEILQKYKSGKARLEKKIVQNEEFWKMRQWGRGNAANESNYMPSTPWLWSCIQGRYSDVMDSYPTCNIQPRQRDDKGEAKKLSDIIPVILAQNDYERTYSDIAWYTLKHGGSVQSVLWDGSKHNGLGDITIKKVDILNFFWQPGIMDIQDSANVFVTELVDNAILEQRYPECRGKLGGQKMILAKYLYDDNVDVSEKSVVVDWYYKTEYNGRRALQYVKFVNDVVLYATENDVQLPFTEEMDPETGVPIRMPNGEPMSARGLYDHAKYPFVVLPLYPVEGSIIGYGLTDIGRDTQIEVDRLNKAFVDNAIVSARPRYFVREDGIVNEEEFADLDRDLVHVAGSLSDETVKAIDAKVLSTVYLEFLNAKIEEMKYTTANQDANNGVAPSGITAASAIAALQETAGKASRSSNMVFHRAYKEVIYLVIELIRQFYDVPRWFRIVPDALGEQFVQYDNAGIVAQPQTNTGMDMGLRLPEFDIEVTTEKASPYKKMEINELALNFYNAGFFNPSNADQALSCLEMMDFVKKDEIMANIRAKGTMQEMLLQYQQLALQLAARINPQLAEGISQNIMQSAEVFGNPTLMAGIDTNAADMDATQGEEHPFVSRARQQARESTQVD